MERQDADLPAEMVELPNIADLQYSAIHAALQAKDSSVDMVNLDVPWVAEFASNDYLEVLRRRHSRGSSNAR